MTEVTIRHARPEDAEAMCAVINPIIARGGTTAHEAPWSPERMRELTENLEPGAFTLVAEAAGRVVGYQYVEPHPELDEDTGDIASFVAIDAAGMGVGRALAAATFAEARKNGLKRLHAYIRADNAGGLAYYESIGFRTIRVDAGVPLKNGTRVDRVAKIAELFDPRD